MNISLYAIQDDRRKLQKTVGTPLATLTGDLHERVSDVQLVVRVPGSAAASVGAANYAFIDTLGKYYFREEFEIENNTLLIHLREDVRMNFAAQILATECTVSRVEDEKKANAYLLDADYQAKAYKKHVQRNFPNSMNDFSFILMTVG